MTFAYLLGPQMTMVIEKNHDVTRYCLYQIRYIPAFHEQADQMLRYVSQLSVYVRVTSEFSDSMCLLQITLFYACKSIH